MQTAPPHNNNHPNNNNNNNLHSSRTYGFAAGNKRGQKQLSMYCRFPLTQRIY